VRVNIAQAAEALRRKATAVQQQARSAEEATAREALALARKQSSGLVSSRELARMGHPYARRRPRPPGSPAVVNRQSGRFQAAWRVVRTGDRLRLVNDARHARYLNDRGTRLMIRRPITRAVAQAIRRSRERRLRAGVQLALDL
jgi:hypothetical protein